MKKIKSNYYKYDIEVENIFWEIIVSIKTLDNKKVIYSRYDLENKVSYSNYINKSLVGAFIKKLPKKVLVIWLWWWAFVKYLEDNLYNVDITSIEIDPSMIYISKNIMWIKSKKIIQNDAYFALDSIKKKYFDVILMDCYENNSKIPNNLINYSFFKKCKKVLKKDWVLSINMANFKKEEKIYIKIHNILKNIFWKYFSILLSWENDISNIIWVYNLEKNYKSSDFTKKFIEYTKTWKLIWNNELIKETYCDEKNIYLK